MTDPGAPARRPRVATIGYEGATLDDVIARLRAAGVTRLIDAGCGRPA